MVFARTKRDILHNGACFVLVLQIMRVRWTYWHRSKYQSRAQIYFGKLAWLCSQFQVCLRPSVIETRGKNPSADVAAEISAHECGLSASRGGKWRGGMCMSAMSAIMSRS